MQHMILSLEYGNDIFSPDDKKTADRLKILNYVATPLGTLRKYDPNTKEDNIISYDMPWDANHLNKK